MTFRERHRIKAARERGRMMANVRWTRERARRDRQALLEAESNPAKIIRRIVVIDNERIVREAVIWSWDSFRSARAKLLSVLRGPNVGAARQHSPTRLSQ